MSLRELACTVETLHDSCNSGDLRVSDAPMRLLILMRTHGVIDALSSSDRSGARAAPDNDDECRSVCAALR